MTKTRLALPVIFFLVLASGALAIDQLISLQGRITSSGSPVNNGNLKITIFTQATEGTAVFDSGTSYYTTIQDGYFDVMLGSQTTLDLNYNQYYYIDMEINGVDIDWNSQERLKFESTSGDTIAGDIKLASGSLRICQTDDLCIKFEQGANANISTNTGDLFIDPGTNRILLNGNTVVSNALTINGGKITFGGSATSGDIYKNSASDIVVNPEGGDIIFMLG